MAVSLRIRLFAILVVAAIAAASTGARAAIDMSTGLHYAIPVGTVQDCSTKAAAALNAYLPGANETSSGSGDWSSIGPITPGGYTAAAVVRCVAVGAGYAVTFTCAVQSGNLYQSSDLCLDVAHTFSGKPTVPLATPTPLPSGCSTTNLVGTWTNDKKGPGFTLAVDGGLTGSDGVSGSWYLSGTTATLTYMGDHVETLSADGKHLTGNDFTLTRKC